MVNSKVMTVESNSLNAVAMDNLFEKVDGLVKEDNIHEYPCVEIDLQKVEFLDPYGLVCLCLLGRHLKNMFKDVFLILPDNQYLQSYLSTMNFAHFAQQSMKLKNANYIMNISRKPSSEVLLELTRIETKDKGHQRDIKNIINEIVERVRTILQNELNFKEKEISNFSTIISELCYNIKDHSEDEGFVTAQRYTRSSDGKKYVIIGVGDLGIGIKNSLGKRFNVSGWSHLDAIIKAIKKEYSTFPNRGLGLYMVSKIIKDYRGALHIRSGDSRLYLRFTPSGVRTCLFPGTQISISLSEIEK